MSNEWLTTGAMIDMLKVGEVAELVNPPEDMDVEKAGLQVKFNIHGNLMYGDGLNFKITHFIKHQAKWRILPNYVSFEEAMKAMDEDKTVYLHYYQYDNPIKVTAATTLVELCNQLPAGLWFHSLSKDVCKWTIEDDTQ